METTPNFNRLADLHMHLGSAATASTLWEIAHDRGIALKEKDFWKFVESIEWVERDNYEDYLKRFDYTEKIQSSPEAVERCVYEAFSLSYRKSNIQLLELRFNPILRNQQGFYDLDKIIFSAIIGMKKAMMIYPMRGGINLIMDRRFSAELNRIIAEKAIKYSREGVIGIDLAGPLNANFKWDDLVLPVARAREAGLGVTVHTGEVTPPAEVWEVLQKINPDRIGHGVKSINDPKLLDELAKRDILLEVCPTSNLRTQECVKDLAEFKKIFQAFEEASVPYTICSDNPVFLDTNVLKEYQMLTKENVLTAKQVECCIDRAFKRTFIPDETLGRIGSGAVLIKK